MTTKKKNSRSPAPLLAPVPSTLSVADITAMLHARIVEAAPEIVEKNIEQAEKGSYLHAKFLFELAGLQACLPEHTDEQEESLAQILLRELENAEPPPPQA
jgi:hypothetical protein